MYTHTHIHVYMYTHTHIHVHTQRYRVAAASDAQKIAACNCHELGQSSKYHIHNKTLLMIDRVRDNYMLLSFVLVVYVVF